MRVLLDLQGAQTVGSRHRGIGRYARAFAKTVIKHARDHEVFISLNGAFKESVDELKSEFECLLPAGRVQVWNPIAPVHFADESNDTRRKGAELYREFIQSTIQPDLIHITSLFEGFGDDAVATIGSVHNDIPTSVTLYDLIPLYFPDHYMANRRFERWYQDRLLQLGRADVILSISMSSKKEADHYYNSEEVKVINVGTDADPQFGPRDLTAKELRNFNERYGIKKPFLLYAGGIDFRKNNEMLIRAFASLPQAVRKKYQLVIVCSILPTDRQRLIGIASEQGLEADDMVITGFVPEIDLVTFYSKCELFVFPSFHEGFGLPVLEAMRCGAPVIASNKSSLPEIVQLTDATFDPHDVKSMRTVMLRALTDAAFMTRLKANSVSQAPRFSWDSIGQAAWQAFEKTVHVARPGSIRSPSRRRLALISPMPPAKSGIADYATELIPELSAFYEIDVVVKDKQQLSSTEYVVGANRLITAEQFAETFGRYDRIVYQFGNSSHHEHMFELLKDTRGVVVLHDFFLSGIVAHREWHGGMRESWWEELYNSHGYGALLFRANADPESEAVWRYPCSKSVLDFADQVIVHSGFSKSLAEDWFGRDYSALIDVIPHLRARPNIIAPKSDARASLDIGVKDFVVCAFGHIGPSKLNLELLEAWKRSGLAQQRGCKLIFVGQVDEGEYADELKSAIDDNNGGGNVSITGWTDLRIFRTYLAAADVAVQLRSLSRGETSGTILDCLNYGLPLIANASGAMADLPANVVTLLPEKFTVEELADALLVLRRQPTLRKKKSQLGKSLIRSQHDPRSCAVQYYESIERGHAKAEKYQRFLDNLSQLDVERDYRIAIAERIDREHHSARPRLFIDVSHLALSDSRTGIQRVVRNILASIIRMESAEFRTEPCFFNERTGRYHYARSFMCDFLNVKMGNLQDDVVDFKVGDTLFCLDLNPIGSKLAASHLSDIKWSGVRVVFVVYDLLPMKIPHCFPPEAETYHRDWLAVVMLADEAFCISESVATDLRNYVKEYRSSSKLKVKTFPLGSDLGRPSAIEVEYAGGDLPTNSWPTFLMVGTIEPRKCHALVLDAFELLWGKGVQANLLLIGKQGWMVESLVERMKKLARSEARFKWISEASDTLLETAYQHSDCLIAASIDEGYGLPLLEAEAYGLSVLARDIPVFREVGGPRVNYFAAVTGEELSRVLYEFLVRPTPPADRADGGMRPTTWDESAAALLELLDLNGSK